MKNAWFHSIGLSTFYKVIPEVCGVLCDTIIVEVSSGTIRSFLV